MYKEIRRVYLVEGALDAWRMGTNAVACFSKKLSSKQKELLINDDGIDELIVCWDSDAYSAALSTAKELADLIGKTGVVRLPDVHDPDSLGEKLVRSIPIRWFE